MPRFVLRAAFVVGPEQQGRRSEGTIAKTKHEHGAHSLLADRGQGFDLGFGFGLGGTQPRLVFLDFGGALQRPKIVPC
ncbi:MAG: hypothetical protein ACO218_01075, partial [Steroidobacteraceae bacterium]